MVIVGEHNDELATYDTVQILPQWPAERSIAVASLQMTSKSFTPKKLTLRSKVIADWPVQL